MQKRIDQRPLKGARASQSEGVKAPLDIRSITRRLVETYREELPLNHLHQSELPNREKAIAILHQVKDILFPDHRLLQRIRQGDTEYHAGGLMEAIEGDLFQQILLARAYAEHDRRTEEEIETQSRADTMEFLSRLPDLRHILSQDVQAAYEGDPAATSFDEIIFCYPGFEAISTYRIAHELHRLGIPLLPRIMTEHAHSVTGCDIHPGAKIGGSFFIDHATGVVIGATAILGERVKLYQGVTLGALSFHLDAQGNVIRTTKRHPTLEDGVVIYAGATVLGGETVIGKGSVIGGSCWITRSLPPYSKVILSEPQMRIHTPSKGETAPSDKSGAKESKRKEADWCI